jgi:predicted dehydrogenase
MHHEWTIKALRAGKHVLCEKPMASNLPETREMFEEAKRAKRVLIEAFMYRAHPLTHAVLDAVRGGAIGELRMIRTSFCYNTTRLADQNIRFRPELAGGGLMDVGCYCISFSRLFAAQEPVEVSAAAHVHESGVDDLACGTMHFPNGVIASFTCGMRVHADNTAYICGSEGYIEIPMPWKPPVTGAVFTIARSIPPRQDLEKMKTHGLASVATKAPRETRTVDAGMDLYALEADAFAECVLDGKEPLVSEQDTLGNMKVLDEMRARIGC